MTIYLKDITNDNWIDCVSLTTHKEGRHFVIEEFVASNAYSIAQSKIQPGWITKAIYLDETLIGFTMYGFCHENNFYEICRLMIDYKYQGKGNGRMALEKVIEEMKKIEDCHELFLCVDEKNTVARGLYEGYQFKNTGRIIHKELLYRLKINRSDTHE